MDRLEGEMGLILKEKGVGGVRGGIGGKIGWDEGVVYYTDNTGTIYIVKVKHTCSNHSFDQPILAR